MNWIELIDTLLAAGHTKADLARLTGADWATIQKLSNGKIKDPSYTFGARLVDLYKQEAVRKLSA